MTDINFADKYRPQTFAEVFGQASAVTCLSGLIKCGRRSRNILLHGSVGSGKTTLARIYARALNCEAPDPDGSPCRNRCDPCKRGDGNMIAGFHEYNVSRDGGGRKEVSSWVQDLNRAERDSNYRILFFDEAQTLTPQACDALLSAVEQPAHRVLFFFATTEVERIRPALRSRVFDLLIRPLPALDAVAFLRKYAGAENIDCEPGALELLAGLRNGYPRDLLLGLERVYDRSNPRLTIEQVRAAFDVDQTEVLVTYFEALADGDLSQQTELVFGWRESLSDKIRWIQAFLVSLYYNNILHRRLIIDGVIEAIPESARTLILDRFCRRLELTRHAELEAVWHQLMDFWPAPKIATDETTLALRLTLFHRLVNGAPGDEAGVAEGWQHAPALSVLTAPTAAATTTAALGFGPPAAASPCAPAEEEPGFPTAADVRQIINCASFLVQEHGILLNTAYEIRPALFGEEEEAAAIALIEAFRHELAAQVEASGGNLFASLTLIERDPLGIVGRVVAHLPRPTAINPSRVNCVERAEIWGQEWRRRDAHAGNGEAIKYEAAVTDEPAALKFHWDKTLGLCAGLSEKAEVWDSATGKCQSLLKLLGVRPRHPGPIFNHPLVSVTALLSDAAIAAACRNRLAPLSAYDDRAWAEISTGWEREEYRERRGTQAERGTELARLCQRFGDDTPEARVAISELVNKWPADPHARRRRWRGWWR